jgi:hypothetical protein
MSSRKLSADAELEMLQQESFGYFLHETNPANGLVIDKTAADWPASIAATGFGLASYPVAVERGFMPRAAAVERTLATLRFFWNSPQGPDPDATGYQGFYYHCLDMRTGRRAWQCELSTIDSAFLRWGIIASDGPGPATIKVSGIERQFFGYLGRGVPYGPDDGTIAPWAAVTSLPFTPEIVLPTIDYYINQIRLKEFNPYGFKATFNPTYAVKSSNPYGWVSPWHYGLNQGPIVLMIENYRTGLLWRLMRDSPYIASGLQRAGFSGGWL